MTDQDAEDEEDEEEARIRALVFGKGESSLLSSFGAESFGAEAKAGVGGATGAESGFYEGTVSRASFDCYCLQIPIFNSSAGFIVAVLRCGICQVHTRDILSTVLFGHMLVFPSCL